MCSSSELTVCLWPGACAPLLSLSLLSLSSPSFLSFSLPALHGMVGLIEMGFVVDDSPCQLQN